MKYKIFITAALMITVWMTEAKAAGDCPKCSFLTIGDPCAKNFSKLHPLYWGCRTAVTTAYFHCSDLVCRNSPNIEEKFEKNKNSCNSNATAGQCVNELNLDVASAMANMKQRHPESLNSAHNYLQPFIEKAAMEQSSKQETQAKKKENKEEPYKNLVK